MTFAATNGSSTITVTDTAHGANEGDFVTFSDATSLGGNITAAVLNQEYQIATVPSTSTFTITAKDTSGATVTANSSDSGNGGSSTVGTYQITTGLDVFVDGTGWGVGAWSSGAWGSTSALTDANQLRLWSMDNFGEDLISNPRAGSVYYWDKTNGLSTRAVALSSISGANLVPTKALQVIVSDIDRHVLVLGADPINAAGTARTGSIDPLLIAFSDQENATEFTLIWTDVALYSLQFIGPPLTFGLNLINEGVSLIGPNGAVNTPAGVFWMDKKGFYSYGGNVTPVPCSVKSYVFDDFNEGQAFQVFAFVNKQFNEVGWFYCSAASLVIDRFVAYNYEEQTWNIGQLSRTAWLDEGIVAFPRAAGKSNSSHFLFQHETGHDDDGSPMTNVFIESADFDMDRRCAVQPTVYWPTFDFWS